MAIIAAYMVPHPPMIVPAVGRGSERQIEATRAAYMRVAEDIAYFAEKEGLSAHARSATIRLGSENK